MKVLEGDRQKQLTKLSSDYEIMKTNIEGQVTKLESKSAELQKKVDLFRQEMLNYRTNNLNNCREGFHGQQKGGTQRIPECNCKNK